METRPSSCHSSSRLSDTHARASKLKDIIDSFIPSFIHPGACPTRMPVHGNSKTSLLDAYVQEFPKKSRFPFPYQVRFDPQHLGLGAGGILGSQLEHSFLCQFSGQSFGVSLGYLGGSLPPQRLPKWSKKRPRSGRKHILNFRHFLGAFFEHF